MGFKMAQIYSFKYTDVKGRVTDRVLMASVVPGTMYAGTDITELDEEQRGLFIAEVDEAKDRFAKEMQAIIDKHDLNYKYRQFRSEKMTDVTKETI